LQPGGAGYDVFRGVPQVKDIGIVREAMKDLLAKEVPLRNFKPYMDGRWAVHKPSGQ
jgi:hypothetical protein